MCVGTTGRLAHRILPLAASSVRPVAPSLCEELGSGSSPSNSWFTSPCMSDVQRSPSLLEKAPVTVNLWLMMAMPRGGEAGRRAAGAMQLPSPWRIPLPVEEFAADADARGSRRPPREDVTQANKSI